MSLAFEIMRVLAWLGLYFISAGMLVVTAFAMVFMVGMLIFGENITDMEPESNKWEEDE